MKIELLIALISGAVALSAGALAIWGQFKSARLAAELEEFRLAEQRQIESEKALSRYREPLARAAYDLQSRLYNILEQGLIAAYYDNGDDRERSYVVDNTAFLASRPTASIACFVYSLESSVRDRGAHNARRDARSRVRRLRKVSRSAGQGSRSSARTYSRRRADPEHATSRCAPPA